ncbi:MAG: AbrB family transcriptional regulator [Paludibacteraceae bacterium]|nr:AbrB family transcriptional regulator [Paludibacteraceae bacterium]
MKIKKESPCTGGTETEANTFTGMHLKCTTISLKNKVLSAFSTGAKYTAKELNVRFFFNDSRKVISKLRREGHNIVDCRLPDGRKEYRLLPDSQLSLFAKGGVQP